MKKIIAIAKIQIIKGKENDYLSLVTPLIEASKTDDTNLVYSVCRDVQNSNEFIVYEEYINEEAFNEHCGTQLFQDFVQQVKPLLAKDIDIQTF